MASGFMQRLALRREQKARARRGDFHVIWFWRAWAVRFVRWWPSPAVPVYRWVLRVGPLEVRRWGP